MELTKDPSANPTLNGSSAATPATPAAKQEPDLFDPELKSTASTESAAATPKDAKTTAPRSSQAAANNTQPSSPPASTGSDDITKVSVIRHLRSDDQIHNNPFDGYIDCIYNVSLGLLSWAAVKKLEGSSQQKVELTASDYTVFASTAEARTSVNYQGDYYNVKSFSFTSFVGHMPQNPMVAVILDGKLKMVQPYGYSFREDLDEMAEKGGYQLLNPLNYIYRLEIWFSGYEPTGPWVQNIPIPVYDNHEIKSIVYYLTVTAVEARVTSTGTEYDLSFQTAAHLALRAEMTMLHKDNVGALKNGSTVNYSKGMQFKDFIKNLAEALHLQVLSDTQNHVNVEYQFFGPTWLFNDKFEQGGKVDFSHAVSFQANTGSHAYTGSNMDILTLLNNVMDQLVLCRKLHLREDDTKFEQPGCLWNIRTNISKVDEKNVTIGNYGKYVFQYIIEPVLSFRSRMTETAQRNEKTDYESQYKRATAIKDYGMLVRVYDYLFTEDNSDIIDFQFLYKNFYYEAYPYPQMPDSSAGAMGGNTNDAAFPGIPKTGADATPPSVQFVVEGTKSSVFEQLRIPVPSQSTSGLNKPETKHGGMNRQALLPASQSMNANERGIQKYQRSKDQYMRFDMINAQITVRFDPVWLLNPYMSGGDFTGELPGSQQQDNIFVYAHVDRVIFIKVYQPNQKNYMNPDFNNVSPRRAPILGGYYQVIQAVSTFEGGRFTQKLNLFKYPHLNYFNTDNTGANAGTGTIKTDSKTPVQPSTAPAPAATQPAPKKELT